MTESIIPILVGIICIFLGMKNMKGDISSIHSYHRHRVSEENRVAFGKMVGIGTIIAGASVILYGVISSISFITENDIFVFIGIAVLAIGMIVGLGISFYAMKKYNNGIF